MAVIDPATSFTFNSQLEKKPRDKLSVAIADADVAAFQLTVNDVDRTLFDTVTAEALKEAWPKITDWSKLVWNDLVCIYNFIVAVIAVSKKGTWSSANRMRGVRLAKTTSSNTPTTARDAIAVAIIADSSIAKFNKLEWDWSALDNVKPSAPRRARKGTTTTTATATTATATATTAVGEKLAIDDALKGSIAKMLGIGGVLPEAQQRVWEELADWATAERIAVSAPRVRRACAAVPSATPPASRPTGRGETARRGVQDQDRGTRAQV